MIDLFQMPDLRDWFWIVGGDRSRAWSSKAGAYVTEWPADRVTRIPTEADLNGVCENLGLGHGPLVTADHVRAEAQRRIIVLVGARDFAGCLVKQLNALMRATELANKRAMGEDLTVQEEAEATYLEGMAAAVKAIRAASNVMEPKPPANYADDKNWP